jgi:hypothetical protein
LLRSQDSERGRKIPRAPERQPKRHEQDEQPNKTKTEKIKQTHNFLFSFVFFFPNPLSAYTRSIEFLVYMKHTQQYTPGWGTRIRNCSKPPPGIRLGIPSRWLQFSKNSNVRLWDINHSYILEIQISGDIRVIGKVRKTQHQNPEFGHTQGDIPKKNNVLKSTLAFNGRWNSEVHGW